MQALCAFEFYLNHSRNPSYKANDLTFPASVWPLLLIKNVNVHKPMRLCND